MNVIQSKPEQPEQNRIKNFVIVNATTAIHNIFNDLKKGAVADKKAMEGLINEMIKCLDMAIGGKGVDGSDGTVHSGT